MKKRDVVIGLLIALILAFLILPFASSSPDGLEKVAEDKGFIEKAEVKPAINSPLPDYAWPGLKDEKMATSLAGIFGTLAVFGLAYAAGTILRKLHQSTPTRWN